jgi:hypothetical protein
MSRMARMMGVERGIADGIAGGIARSVRHSPDLSPVRSGKSYDRRLPGTNG